MTQPILPYIAQAVEDLVSAIGVENVIAALVSGNHHDEVIAVLRAEYAANDEVIAALKAKKFGAPTP